MDAYLLVCRAVVPVLGSFYAWKLCNDYSLSCWSFQVLVCAIGRKHFYLVPNEGRTDLTPIDFQFGCVERPFAYENKICAHVDRLSSVALSFEQFQLEHDTFDLERLMQKFQDGRDFDWDDLGQLLNRAVVIDRDRITADCVRGFGFLANLTDDERTLACDQYQRVKGARREGAPA
jgi:hypothetical protein